MANAGEPIPQADDVARYIAPKYVDNGIVLGMGFLRRPHETASSINWLNAFAGEEATQIEQVKNLKRITYAKTGCIAVINVGETTALINSAQSEHALSFVHDPLEAEGEYIADPSHALIHGIPAQNSPQLDFLNALLTQSVKSTHTTT